MDILTATCLSSHCFCEALSRTGLVQPINSFSSLAFALAGVGGFFAWKKTKMRKSTPEVSLILFFSLVLIFIGLSSFYYHATLSFDGQFLDIFSMYLFGTLLMIGALMRRGNLSGRKAIILFIVANIVLGVIQYVYPEARRILFALILLPGVILELLPRTVGATWSPEKMKYLLIGVGLLAVAYVIWILDQNNIVCWPGSLVQGHAIWHVFGAAAGFMIILHYIHTPHSKKTSV